MTLSIFLKQSPRVAGLAAVLSVGSLAIVNPAQAASLDLSTWTISGDAVTSPNSATITNAFADGSDDAGPNNNVSGNNPLDVNLLETSLSLPPGSLGTDATEGSAISTLLSSINAGDVFSFDWNFSLLDIDGPDRGFVTIDDLSTAGLEGLFTLTAPSPFSFSFSNAGNYRIGIGVIDVGDNVSSSVLNVSNAQVTPIPTPALLPGLIGLALAAIRKRKSGAA